MPSEIPPPPDETESFIMLLRNMDDKAEFWTDQIERSRTVRK
jgi:hypothetical protein